MKRPAVIECMKFWAQEAARLQKEHGLDSKFPFLKVKAVVHMIFYDGLLLFANAKSRPYQPAIRVAGSAAKRFLARVPWTYAANFTARRKEKVFETMEGDPEVCVEDS